MMGRGRGGGLPIDWIGCPKLAIGLVHELFLVFKTPLSSGLNRNVSNPELQFHLSDVFLELERLENDKVLWIDLTNTERYYPRGEVSSREGFSYIKMPMLGHGMPPSQMERNSFNNAVDTFVKGNPNGIVAVHCTHGFNRTGFLISYYLMNRRGLSAHDAVSEFRIKRPPGIYRKNYVDHLYQLGQEQNSSGNFCDNPNPPPATKGNTSPIRITVETPSWVSSSEDKKSVINHGRSRWDAGTDSSRRSKHFGRNSHPVAFGGQGDGNFIQMLGFGGFAPAFNSHFAEDVNVSNFDANRGQYQWELHHNLNGTGYYNPTDWRGHSIPNAQSSGGLIFGQGQSHPGYGHQQSYNRLPFPHFGYQFPVPSYQPNGQQGLLPNPFSPSIHQGAQLQHNSSRRKRNRMPLDDTDEDFNIRRHRIDSNSGN